MPSCHVIKFKKRKGRRVEGFARKFSILETGLPCFAQEGGDVESGLLEGHRHSLSSHRSMRKGAHSSEYKARGGVRESGSGAFVSHGWPSLSLF